MPSWAASIALLVRSDLESVHQSGQSSPPITMSPSRRRPLSKRYARIGFRERPETVAKLPIRRAMVRSPRHNIVRGNQGRGLADPGIGTTDGVVEMPMKAGATAAAAAAKVLPPRATPRWTVMLAPSPPPGTSSIVEAAGDLLTELNEEEEEEEDDDEEEGDEDGDDEDEDDETPAQAVAKALAPVAASKAMAATSSDPTSPDPVGGVAGGTGGARTVYDILFGTPSAFDRLQALISESQDEKKASKAMQARETMAAAMMREWRERSYLERQAFFAAVRAARGEWPDADSTPDGLCLDLLESFALTADGKQTAAVFGGVLRCEQTALDILLTQQAQWYTNLAVREAPLCRLALEEMPDSEALQELTASFCTWFGRYVSRFLEATREARQIVCPGRRATPLEPTEQQGALATRLMALTREGEEGGEGTSDLMFVKVERLKFWARADADVGPSMAAVAAAATAAAAGFAAEDEFQAPLGSPQTLAAQHARSASADEMPTASKAARCRPIALMLADVASGRFAGQPQSADASIETGCACAPFWLSPPTSEQVLTQMLVLLNLTACLPRMLAFDGDAAEHAVALAPFLYERLGIRVVVSSIELPLVMQEDIDDMNMPMYFATFSPSTCLFASPFQWNATPLLQIKGSSVDLVRRLYEAMDTWYRSSGAWRQAAGDGRPAPLAVLLPGGKWRLCVPIAPDGSKSGGGLVVEELSGARDGAPAAPLAAAAAAAATSGQFVWKPPSDDESAPPVGKPGLLLVEREEVPFADADALALHQLRRQPAGPLVPVPLLAEGSLDLYDFAATEARPSVSDLKWMLAALPAVAEFLDEHWARVTEMLYKKQTAPTRSHVHARSGVQVRWPPPTPEELGAELL